MQPIICARLPGTRDIRYFQTKLFFLPYVHCQRFRNKIASPQRNVHIIQILRKVTPKRVFFVCA